jgi:hypothetical protein
MDTSYATRKEYTSTSHNISVSILLHYCEPWKEPLDINELSNLVSGKVNKQDAEVLNKYLCICKDGIVRVRKSHKELIDWRDRYYSNIHTDWNSLGILA